MKTFTFKINTNATNEETINKAINSDSYITYNCLGDGNIWFEFESIESARNFAYSIFGIEFLELNYCLDDSGKPMWKENKKCTKK